MGPHRPARATAPPCGEGPNPLSSPSRTSSSGKPKPREDSREESRPPRGAEKTPERKELSAEIRRGNSLREIDAIVTVIELDIISIIITIISIIITAISTASPRHQQLGLDLDCLIGETLPFSALQQNGTWNLVPPVPGVNLIDSKWVFKVKLRADGSVERYKARLVAKGFKQRSTVAAIPRLIAQLRSEFSVKDLGVLQYFLGIEVHSPSPGSLHLRQRKYALELLARAGMLKCSPVTTPMASSERLCSTDGAILSSDEATQYRSLVGGLQYLTVTRPDLSFVVNKVCQYLHEPRTPHMTAVKRILRYVRFTIDSGLLFRSSSSTLHSAFSDADWTGSMDDRRSTRGYAIFYGGNLIA
ncbi:hypothetical protein QYE76_034289 [Lolium multiflorum]|uniref:Reverse transcriptase Ty1/copia-type domain-containing protein n=1 Tax=Lolium multiflorum TaxID=4521 RepID=A0AAD8QYM0_LOLMU|nr:hypothetical protein QYE76_034289 [Lolium multiflorum]